jgi:hypothetical protein
MMNLCIYSLIWAKLLIAIVNIKCDRIPLYGCEKYLGYLISLILLAASCLGMKLKNLKKYKDNIWIFETVLIAMEHW